MSLLQKIKNRIFKETNSCFEITSNIVSMIQNKNVEKEIYVSKTVIGVNNLVILTLDDGSISKIPAENFNMAGLSIVIHGDNNTIEITSNTVFINCEAHLMGSNNKLVINKSKYQICNSLFLFGAFGNDRVISIGNDFYGGAHFRLMEDNTSITIGNNCTFSWNVLVMATDYHSILNGDKKVTNISKGIEIGSHVWCGCNSTILKNVTIPSNSIIATGSVVTKSFTSENIIIGGNPAKIIKNGMEWDMEHPHKYMITRNNS
ncbi:acyltransferase [Shigella dysenteriae]|nr:acyltransferase [Shigella dysenteriae]MJD67237.1 acyltransferase [Shigella dysenteriae]